MWRHQAQVQNGKEFSSDFEANSVSPLQVLCGVRKRKAKFLHKFDGHF